MAASQTDSADAADLKAENQSAAPDKRHVLPKPQHFSEVDSFQYLLSLIKAGKHREVRAYLIEILPELAACKLHEHEKFNQLFFIPRLIQKSGMTKHGVQRLLRKVRVVERNITGIELPKGGAFADFGCGPHDPVAMATYFYANGFAKVHAIDLQPPRNEIFSALSMYDLLANMQMFPRRYCRPDVKPDAILERIRIFNAAAFERGDFRRGMAAADGNICYEPVDISQSSIEPESLSLLVSSTVLEHVSDLDDVCRKIYDSLMPGGVAYHFIDMADHRSFRRNSEFGPLSFLTEEVAPRNQNRLRKSEQLAAHQGAGFDIVNQSSVNAVLDDDIRSRLVERYRGLDDDDISTIKMHLTVRKPLRVN